MSEDIMGLLPHELYEPAPTPKQVESAENLLRAHIADAIFMGTNNRLTPEQHAAAIEAELCAQGFDATVKVFIGGNRLPNKRA